MTTGLESLSAAEKALGTLKDLPLWLMIGFAVFLLLFPILPGAAAFASPAMLGWARIVGILFAILAACRFAGILIPHMRAWKTLRDERRTLHLTLDDTRSFWAVSRQPDGSMTTQFALHFMAKNRSNGRVRLLKARIIRPRFPGGMLQDLVLVRELNSNAYGSAQYSGTYIPAGEMLPASATIIVRGEPKQESGNLRVVFGVSDEDGNEIKAAFDLRHAGRLGAPTSVPLGGVT